MNKKKLAGWLSAFAGIAATIVATRQPHTAPAQPWPTVAILAEWQQTCRAVVQEQSNRATTPEELAACIGLAREGKHADDLRVWADTLPKAERPALPAPVVVHLEPLKTAGPIFTQGGIPFRWKGVTAFGLLNRYAHGEDIQPFLADFAGFNVLRVFLYTPAKDWGASAWEPPAFETIRAFLAECERAGFYVELVALTDDDPARIEPAKLTIAALTGIPNVLWEAGNEPTTHKTIATGALRGALAASGALYSSGDYEDSNRFYGSFLTAHTGRDPEWPRRAHDLLEYYQGGGPNAPTDPAHKVPVVADEPIRPDQAGFNVEDFRAYFGASALLGAGATYHAESMKLGNPPTEDEKRIAAVVLEALSAFPADAPKGPYSRPVESSLRTYIVGPYMVRVRPSGNPPSGWRCEASGILCRS